MSEQDLIRALTELLEKSRRRRMALEDLEAFLEQRTPLDPRETSAKAQAIVAYVKSVVATDPFQELLKLTSQKRQLTVLLDIVTSIDWGAGNNPIPRSIWGRWHPKLEEIDARIKELQQQMSGQWFVLKVMLRELRDLGYREDITLPDEMLALPPAL